MPLNRDQKLPSFIVVGPMRTATTWLHAVLVRRVNLPQGVNEPMFFDRHYGKGLDWYLSHFGRDADRKIRGEIAPTYFHSADARARIRKHIPNCCIVCTLRDPVERLYSYYRLMLEYGVTRAPFEVALREEPQMLESSRYSFHVRAWQETFGQQRVLVLLNDDLRQDAQAYVDRLCDFVGLPRFELTTAERKPRDKAVPARWAPLARAGSRTANALRRRGVYWPINLAKRLGLRGVFFGGGREAPPLSQETAAKLRKRLLPEVEALERLLGRDLGAWKVQGA